MSDFITIINQVITKAKLTASDTTLLVVVKDEINRAIYALARERKIPELFKVNGGTVNLSLALATPFLPIDLAAEVLEATRFFYITTTAPIKSWDLYPRDSVVPPAAVYGRPNYYEICRGSISPLQAVDFGPRDQIDSVNDVLYYSYYVIPIVLVGDGDLLPSIHWDDEIVRRACANIAIRDNKIEQAQALNPSSHPQPVNQAPQ